MMGVQGLENSDLLKTLGFIGKWCHSDSGDSYEVSNPATGVLLARVPSMGKNEAERAIDLADEALEEWQRLGVDARGKILHGWANLIRDHKDDLGKIVTQENGKPLAEAVGEVAYSASFVDWFAEEAGRQSGELIPAHFPGQRLIVNYEAVGIGVAITPWNFPAAMVTRKVAPALAAGCTIVLKPSEYTPLSALAFVELANRAGIPRGVFSVVVGDRKDALEIGTVFTSHPKVRKLSFTGSTAVGRRLGKECMSNLKRLSLELGGNAAFIVFEDADLESALEGLMVAKFRNAGQTCVAANRILVHEAIHDRFVERMIDRVENLKIGNGLDEGVQIGPLINSRAVEKTERHLADAVKKGASIVRGGDRHTLGGTYFEPTILVGARPGMLPFEEETFGPVASFCRFSEDDEAITIANETPYGLATYFYTNNRSRCWNVCEKIQSGIVCENTVAFSSARAPFGGFKQSGIGREGGREGLREWQEVKYRCIGDI
jgi:succinate-semialdehyde dehydrogenase/glutarate-semialdehyde dehydrogenase